MRITVELPDDLTRHTNPGREALETLVIEGYRTRNLTQFQAGHLLGFSRAQTEDFLARHVDLYDYSNEELAAEAELICNRAGSQKNCCI